MRLAITLAAVMWSLVAIRAAHGAEATSVETFRVEATFETLTDWFDANRPQVYETSNCEILEDLGDLEFRVKSTTPLGACIYLVKETQVDSPGQRVYEIRLIRNIKGRIVAQSTDIQVTDRGDYCEVEMTLAVTFKHLLASNGRVRKLTDASVTATGQLLANTFRR